jgi:molybdopterin-guanine dinucleotide biosynthesis protein A
VLRLAEVCGEVVIVIGPQGPEPDLPRSSSLRVARDPVEGRGPLAGLVAGLPGVRTALVLVAAGDMPTLSTAVLAEMLQVAGTTEGDAVALQDGETLRPLPVVLRMEPAGGTARALLDRGERSLLALLRALRVTSLDESTWRALDPEGMTLRDVDRPEDLTG